MSKWRRLIVVQTAGRITDLLSANSTCAFSLHGYHKTIQCQRDCMPPSWHKTGTGKHSSMISADVWIHWNTKLKYLDENWTVFRNTVHSLAMDFQRPVSRKHQDWFHENDEGIQGLLEEKHKKRKAYSSDTSSVSSVFWLTKNLSWKDGLNIVTVSLKRHHLSMIKLPTDNHRWNVIHCLMSSKSSLKQWKQYTSCHLARLQDQMQYLLRSTKQEILQLQRNWQSYFTLCGEQKTSLKNSIMHQLFTYSNGKGNPQAWDNHRGISLLSIAGKILARVLLNRLN